MPTGISQSVISPAALVPRGTPESAQQVRREAPVGLAAGEENARSVGASNQGDQLVRAPEADAGGQGVENNVSASAGAAANQGREPLATTAGDQPENAAGDDGLGGILDVAA